MGVASATARKALAWMNEQGIIGYHAGKNGVGIRIFINRAASSIGRKPDQGQKNLRLVPASSADSRTSSVEAPFKESFAMLDNLDRRFYSARAEKRRGGNKRQRRIPDLKTSPGPLPVDLSPRPTFHAGSANRATAIVNIGARVVERIAQEIVPKVKSGGSPGAGTHAGMVYQPCHAQSDPCRASLGLRRTSRTRRHQRLAFARRKEQ